MPMAPPQGLSNINPAALTQTFLPFTANGTDLGSAAFPFGNVYGSNLFAGVGALTTGTMTPGVAYSARVVIHSFAWTNAMVVALGSGLTGDVTVCTLPAKTVVHNCYVVITGAGAGVTTLTVAVGRTAAGYIDYIVASDAKAAANTVYGNASGERGTNLTSYDLPAYAGTTDVKAHFISTVENLDQTTGSTGLVILETSLAP